MKGRVHTKKWKWYCWHCGWKQNLNRFPSKDTRKCPNCGRTAKVREQ